MSVSTIIERILGKQRERQQSRLADFDAVVRQIADGDEPDADQVDCVLAEAGKSLDDLRQAVEQLNDRRALKAQWDRLPKLMQQRQQVQDQIAAANREFEAAETRHDEALAPLECQMRDLKEQTWAAEQARQRLWLTCPNQSLRDQLDEITAKQRALQEESRQFREAIDRLKGLAKADRAHAASLLRDPRSDDLRQQADQRDAEAGQLQSRLKAAEKELAKLQKQEDAVRTEMLVP